MTGSPPQVRGKLHVHSLQLISLRITPAGAGKTPQIDNLDIPNPRITPAGAGKTIPAAIGCHRVKDHPRRCGENYWRQLRCLCWAGSPPQVRGKHADTEEPPSADGITPAGAGKTFTVFYMRILIQDHPRRCGENSAM